MFELMELAADRVMEQVCTGKKTKLRWAEVDGEKWICAVDIARALNYEKKKGQAVTQLVEDKANIRTFHFVVDGLHQEGKPDMVFVNRKGVLDIISTSESEVARAAWRATRDAVFKIWDTQKQQAAPVTETLALPAPAAARVLPDFTLLIEDRRDQNEVTNEQKEAYGNEGVRAIRCFYEAGLITQRLMEVALYDDVQDGKPVRVFDRNDAEELWAFCAFVNSTIMFPDENGKLETNDKMWKGYEFTDDIFSEFVAFMCGGVTWTDNRAGKWRGGFRNMHNLPGNKFDFIGIKDFNYTQGVRHPRFKSESDLSPFEQFLRAGWGYEPTRVNENRMNLRAWKGVRLRKRSDRTMQRK